MSIFNHFNDPQFVYKLENETLGLEYSDQEGFSLDITGFNARDSISTPKPAKVIPWAFILRAKWAVDEGRANGYDEILAKQYPKYFEAA